MRCFFHIEGSFPCRDLDGAELRDVASAEEQGARVLAEYIREWPSRIWDSDLAVTVTDERGLILMSAQILTTKAPVLSGR
jgi:hypothetical protein